MTVTITINEVLLWLLGSLAVAGWTGTWFFAKSVYRNSRLVESDWDAVFGAVLFVALLVLSGTILVGFILGVT